jgi:hypothetical protein
MMNWKSTEKVPTLSLCGGKKQNVSPGYIWFYCIKYINVWCIEISANMGKSDGDKVHQEK